VNGLQLTTTSNSAFICSLNVVVVPILVSLATRRLPAPASAAGICLAVLGTFFLTGARFPLNAGDTITLGAALFGGLHILLVGRFVGRCQPAVFACGQMVVTAVAGAVLASITGFGAITSVALIASLAAGILQGAGLGLQILAQRSVAPSLTVLFLSSMPVWASVFGAANGERLTALSLAGAALILGGIAITQLRPGLGRRAIASAKTRVAIAVD
jgi:drug/metabolite transporter (DMT)-like permease